MFGRTAVALLMPFRQLQSNPKAFKSNRENLKKQLNPSIEVNRKLLLLTTQLQFL